MEVFGNVGPWNKMLEMYVEHRESDDKKKLKKQVESLRDQFNSIRRKELDTANAFFRMHATVLCLLRVDDVVDIVLRDTTTGFLDEQPRFKLKITNIDMNDRFFTGRLFSDVTGKLLKQKKTIRLDEENFVLMEHLRAGEKKPAKFHTLGE